MDYSNLKKNIIDVLKEEQIKLGYRSETVRLYYPLLSLNRFLSTNYSIDQMNIALQGFCSEVKEIFGNVEISNVKERFCFTFPPQTSDYVHTNMDDTEFIADFIQSISKHDTKIEEIIQLFQKYSDHVHFEKVTHGEFDYLLYFEDGKPDEFRYCITDEGCHMIYHRFTIDDYQDFGFEP